jgi:hypothetical protein
LQQRKLFTTKAQRAPRFTKKPARDIKAIRFSRADVIANPSFPRKREPTFVAHNGRGANVHTRFRGNDQLKCTELATRVLFLVLL